jgi:Family of unknown function (DUF5320)
MPNFDGTGPSGQGPLTGRRRGRCRDDKKIKLKLLIIILAIKVKPFLVLGAAEDEEEVRAIQTGGWEEVLEEIK